MINPRQNTAKDNLMRLVYEPKHKQFFLEQRFPNDYLTMVLEDIHDTTIEKVSKYKKLKVMFYDEQMISFPKTFDLQWKHNTVRNVKILETNILKNDVGVRTNLLVCFNKINRD